MRMLLDITVPHEPFNSLVRKGVAGKKLGEILDALKPEAVYFSEHDGKRGAVVIVDEAGQIGGEQMREGSACV